MAAKKAEALNLLIDLGHRNRRGPRHPGPHARISAVEAQKGAQVPRILGWCDVQGRTMALLPGSVCRVR